MTAYSVFFAPTSFADIITNTVVIPETNIQSNTVNTNIIAASGDTVANGTNTTKKDDASQAMIDSANMLLYILKWCYMCVMW